MKSLKYFCFFTLLTLALFTNCAKRGTITGGDKDTIAPIILNSSPANFTTNFKENTIEINFDEYVKLNKVNQQLIISPPMDIQPEITPMGYPSKFIKIKLFDTLQPNTTYSFNFGESIEDNNEGNKLLNFKYVFSTGSYIDSLKLNTTYKDAYTKKSEGQVNVLLYQAENFTDSTIYKKKPLYVATATDSLKQISLENLKAGNYYIVALQEKNSNYKYEPKIDKIGFLPQPISVPNDSVINLTLFKERQPLNVNRPTMVSQNKWLVPYEGDIKNVKISTSSNSKQIANRIVKVPQKDSLYVFTPLEKLDSIQFRINESNFSKTYDVKTRNIKLVDTLQIKYIKQGNFQFRDTLAFTNNTPISSINKALISFHGKDSIQIPFDIKMDSLNNTVKILFDKKENENYTFTLKENSVTDFYNNTNKTALANKFSTGIYTDYGTITYKLNGNINYPVLFELLTKKEEVYDFKYLTSETDLIKFTLVNPDKYFVRIIEDKNKNKQWDTGSYKDKLQPEKVFLFEKEFDIRANWDINETIVLP